MSTKQPQQQATTNSRGSVMTAACHHHHDTSAKASALQGNPNRMGKSDVVRVRSLSVGRTSSSSSSSAAVRDQADRLGFEILGSRPGAAKGSAHGDAASPSGSQQQGGSFSRHTPAARPSPLYVLAPDSGSSFAEPLVLRVSGMARKTPGSAYHGSGGGDSPGAGSSSTAGLRRALAGAGARDLVGAAGELQQRAASLLGQRPASAPLATSLGLSAVASHGAGLGLVSPPLSARVHSISASAVSEGLAPGGPGATGTGMAGSALSAAPKQRPASAGVLYSKALPSGGGHVGAMAGGHGATAGAGAGTGKAAAVAVGGSAVSKARLSSPFVRSLSSSGSAAAAVVAGSGARAGGVLRRSFDGAWGGQGATAAGGSSIATVPSKPNVHETPASTLGGAAAVAVRAPSPPAQPPPNERSRPSVVARSAWGPGTPGNVGALVAEPASAASLKSRVMRLGLQRCLSAPGLGSAAETETGTGAGTAAGAPSAASAPDVAAAATRQPPSPRTWQDSDRGAAEGQDHGGFDAAAPTAAASSRSSSTSSSHGSGARTVATGSGTSASASGSAAALASAAQPQAQAPVCPTVAAAATGNAGGSTDPFAAAAVSAVSGGQHATTTAASMASAAAAVAKPGVSQATAAFTPLAIGSGSSGSGTGAGGPRAVGQPAPAVPASAALQRSTSMPAGSSSASPAAAGAGGRPHTPATCAFGLSTIVNRDPAPTQTVQPQPQPPSKAAARADGTVVAGAGAVGNSSTASTASGTVASHGGAAGAAAAAAGRGSSAEAGPGTGRTLTPSHSLTREAAKHLTVDLSQVRSALDDGRTGGGAVLIRQISSTSSTSPGASDAAGAATSSTTPPAGAGAARAGGGASAGPAAMAASAATAAAAADGRPRRSAARELDYGTRAQRPAAATASAPAAGPTATAVTLNGVASVAGVRTSVARTAPTQRVLGWKRPAPAPATTVPAPAQAPHVSCAPMDQLLASTHELAAACGVDGMWLSGLVALSRSWGAAGVL